MHAVYALAALNCNVLGAAMDVRWSYSAGRVGDSGWYLLSEAQLTSRFFSRLDIDIIRHSRSCPEQKLLCHLWKLRASQSNGIPPTIAGALGRQLEDHFPLLKTPCQVPCEWE